MKKFNPTLFVYMEEEGGESYWLVQESVEDCADDEPRIVGIYKLDKIVKVTKTVKIETEDIK